MKAHLGKASIAGQYAASSRTWKRRFKESHSTLMDIYNGDDSVLQQCDMNPVCSHFIVIEGLNHTKCKISKGAGVSFRASFVECTVAKLPSVVVQALSTSQETHSFHELADVARRKLPLVLLDCRERWPLIFHVS